MYVKLVQKLSARGFAIMSTLAVAAFLLFIGVALLTLSTVNVRSVSADKHEKIALANAEMALLLALEHLQETMGSDQRVTMKADYRVNNVDLPNNLNRHWLGAWSTVVPANQRDSYEVNDDSSTVVMADSKVDWNFQGVHWPVIGKRPDLDFDYKDKSPYGFPGIYVDLRSIDAELNNEQWKDKLRLSWLVSGAKTADITTDYKAADMGVQLVGAGSAGDDETQHVHVPIVKINNIDGDEVGRYAYYISDNNQKVVIGREKHTDDDSNSSETKLIGKGSNISAIEGYANFAEQAKKYRQKYITRRSLALGEDEELSNKLKTNYHDFTYYASGLFTNPVMGGLKKDLTSVLSAKSNVLNPIFKRPTTGASKQDFHVNAPIIPGERKAITGPQFASLRSWGQLANQSVNGGVIDAIIKPRIGLGENGENYTLDTALRPGNDAAGKPSNTLLNVKTWATQAPGLHPIMVKGQLQYALLRRGNSSQIPSGSNSPFIMVYKPLVVMWNPYNVALRMPKMAVSMSHPVPIGLAAYLAPSATQMRALSYRPKPGQNITPSTKPSDLTWEQVSTGYWNFTVMTVHLHRAILHPEHHGKMVFVLEESVFQPGEALVFTAKGTYKKVSTGFIENASQYHRDNHFANVLSAKVHPRSGIFYDDFLKEYAKKHNVANPYDIIRGVHTTQRFARDFSATSTPLSANTSLSDNLLSRMVTYSEFYRMNYPYKGATDDALYGLVQASPMQFALIGILNGESSGNIPQTDSEAFRANANYNNNFPILQYISVDPSSVGRGRSNYLQSNFFVVSKARQSSGGKLVKLAHTAANYRYHQAANERGIEANSADAVKWAYLDLQLNHPNQLKYFEGLNNHTHEGRNSDIFPDNFTKEQEIYVASLEDYAKPNEDYILPSEAAIGFELPFNDRVEGQTFTTGLNTAPDVSSFSAVVRQHRYKHAFYTIRVLNLFGNNPGSPFQAYNFNVGNLGSYQKAVLAQSNLRANLVLHSNLDHGEFRDSWSVGSFVSLSNIMSTRDFRWNMSISNGYFTTNPFGHYPGDWSSSNRVVLFDIPKADKNTLSLGELKNVNLSLYSWAPSMVIGNSLAPLDAPYRYSASPIWKLKIADLGMTSALKGEEYKVYVNHKLTKRTRYQKYYPQPMLKKNSMHSYMTYSSMDRLWYHYSIYPDSISWWGASSALQHNFYANQSFRMFQHMHQLWFDGGGMNKLLVQTGKVKYLRKFNDGPYPMEEHNLYEVIDPEDFQMQVGDVAVTKQIHGKTVTNDDPITHYDMSYETNVNLWDDYFFSSVPYQNENDQFIFDLEKPLSNPLYTWNDKVQTANSFRERELANEEDFKAANHGFWQNGYWLKNKAAFNVNSTSVVAWQAFLSSLKQKFSSTGEIVTLFSSLSKVAEIEGNTMTANSAAALTGSRSLSDDEIKVLAEKIVDIVKRRGPFLSLADFVNRRLEVNEGDTQAERAMAPQLVGHVFQSDPSMRGVLEQAIEDATINQQMQTEDLESIVPVFPGKIQPGDRVYTNDVAWANLYVEGPPRNQWQDKELKSGIWAWRQRFKVALNDYLPREKDDLPAVERDYSQALRYYNTPRSKVWGIPGYVTQSDLLVGLAPFMTVRGDTFTIRVCGQSVENGEVKATVCLEAIVERTPEYVEGAPLNEAQENTVNEDGKVITNKATDRNLLMDRVSGQITSGNLTALNKELGRRFRITVVRKLSPQEI